MDKQLAPREEIDESPADIEFWEDDCGLSDLAKDAFDQLKKRPDRGPAKTVQEWRQ
jgi:hypothetical protein